MLLGVAAVTWFYVERIDYYFDRNRLAGEQLDSVIRMSASMNRYSENVAELLLLGRPELQDFNEARSSLELNLFRLERLILNEITYLNGRPEQDNARAELERVRRMRTLYEDIDLRTQQLLFLRDQDRQDEALQIFRDEIENRLDTSLEEEMAGAIADEERTLVLVNQKANQLERQLRWIISLATLSAFAITASAALLLSRMLRRPIDRLASATQAIAAGDLGHRIAYEGKDELADLTRQFNIAAAQLETQRNELLQVQSGLETQIVHRTGELEEANARLKQLDRMRMLFLADIGHELRTPLTILQGEAEVELRGRRSVTDHRETLQRIVQLTRQMSRLVDDLLFLARAEVDAVRFVMQPASLHHVLRSVLDEARVLLEGRQLDLDTSLGDDPCMLDGDAGRLTQALLIVLDNAIKYADVGSTVFVGLSRDNGVARVVMRNFGLEIPAADLPFVFSRFYRGEGSVLRSQSGSGLGLSIAKWIIEGHRGQIALNSQSLVTEVTITLPVSS